MEINYGALFGIDAGGNEQEAAEPAEPGTAQDEAEEAQGAEEQEAAEPAGEETQDTAADGVVDDEQAAGEEHSDTGRTPQTPEQNAAFAAARRKAEAQRDAAVEEARRSAQEEAKRLIDEAFRNSGLTNPYTQQPITTKEEYEAYRQRYNAERKDRVLKKSGMSDEEFNAFVSDLPEVKAAREAQAAAERAQKEANEAQARVKMDEQLREIGKLNPNIRELRDLAAMETYPKFYELVKRGNTLVDAYRLANFEALTSSAAQATRQAAINSVQSKQHMGATRERGTGAVSVPADVKEMYRALNPGATDAEIQSHYNRTHRKS